MTRSQRLGDSPHAGHCAGCGAPLAHDQRYCISCGVRRGPLPADVEAMLHHLRRTRPIAAATPVAAVEPPSPGWQLPTPRIASLCVMAMLSFGVIAGSLTQPGGASSLARTLIVAVSPPAAQPVAAAGTSGGGLGGGGGGAGSSSAGGGAQTITETITQSAPATTAATTPAAGPTGGGSNAGSNAGGSGSAAVSLPPIKHVFLIMLSDQGYTQSFGTTTGHPYLASTLRRQGELITNYYGVAPSSLATGIALLSGQGPTQDTAANCPVFTDVVATGSPGSASQVVGNGCVYPQTTGTLPGELADNGNTWTAYIQSMDQQTGGPPGQPTSCRHPAPGAQDPNQAPQANDPYVTWRNPFVYFDSLTSGTACHQNDVDLSQLSHDLKQASTTANFSYIVPDPCNDGSDQPCRPGAPAGLAQTDAFLKTVVPEIKASAAYRQDGLIVITFDQAPQSGANADSSSCCSQPTFPNLGGSWALPAAAGAGSTDSSTTSSTSVTAPASPITSTASSTTPTTPTTTANSTPSSITTGTTTSGTTSCPSTSATPTPSTTTSSTSTTTSTTTSTATGTPCATPGSPLGGGQVGALLISRYVKAGSSDAVDTFNHFSLLKTIEDLFSINQLGYSKDPALPEFDSAIFNASQS